MATPNFRWSFTEPLAAIQLEWLDQLGVEVDGIPHNVLRELYPDVLSFGTKVAQVEALLDLTERTLSSGDVGEMKFVDRLIEWAHNSNPSTVTLPHRESGAILFPMDVEGILLKTLSRAEVKDLFQGVQELAYKVQDLTYLAFEDVVKSDKTRLAFWELVAVLIHENSFPEDELIVSIMQPWSVYAREFWAAEFPDLEWDGKP